MSPLLTDQCQLAMLQGLLQALQHLKFTGDVDALSEGTVFFADEPILRVTAPLPQARLVETRLINLLQYPTLVASQVDAEVEARMGRLPTLLP